MLQKACSVMWALQARHGACTLSCPNPTAHRGEQSVGVGAGVGASEGTAGVGWSVCLVCDITRECSGNPVQCLSQVFRLYFPSGHFRHHAVLALDLPPSGSPEPMYAPFGHDFIACFTFGCPCKKQSTAFTM